MGFLASRGEGTRSPGAAARVDVDRALVLVIMGERAHPGDDVGGEEAAFEELLQLGVGYPVVVRPRRLSLERAHRRQAPVARREDELGPPLVDDPEPGVLVVAAEGDDARLDLRGQLAHEVDDLLGPGAAIEVVADEDDGVRLLQLGERRDEPEQRLCVAVDIAYRERPVHLVRCP